MFPHIGKQLIDKMKEAIEEKEAAPALLNDKLQEQQSTISDKWWFLRVPKADG